MEIQVALETATDLEEELDYTGVKLNYFISKFEICSVSKENPTITTNFKIPDLSLPIF